MSAGMALALDLFSRSAGETPAGQPAGRRRYFLQALLFCSPTFCGAIFSAALVALLSQAPDLFYVVQAVDEMKLSPLCGRQRAEDRMVQ